MTLIKMEKQKIVIAITGASGAIYAKVLLDKLQQLSTQIEELGIVMSDNAKEVWKFELQFPSYTEEYMKLLYFFKKLYI